MEKEPNHQQFMRVESLDLNGCADSSNFLEKIKKQLNNSNWVLSLESNKLRIEIPINYPHWKKDLLMSCLKQMIQKEIFPVVTREANKSEFEMQT